MTDQARFTAEVVDGVSMIAICGEVDLSNAAQLKQCLERTAQVDHQGVVVDLTKAEYFDSRTIALLAAFAQTAQTRRQRLALVAPSNGFGARILNVTGLSKIIPTFQSTSKAAASVKLPTNV